MMAIGERLKMARKISGLSQQGLGDRAGVSKMSISKYEREEATPKSSILINLAEALDVSIEYLLRPIEVTFSHPEFRKRTKLSKTQEKKIIECTHDWIERYLQVEALFDNSPEFNIDKTKYKVNKIEDVENLAIQLRKDWELGLDPIDNLMEVLENNGVKIWSINHNFEHFDALKMWVNDTIPIIVVKDDIPGDRQRFNLSHELGHLILEISDKLDNEKVVNRFAGAFLVPPSRAYEELGYHRRNISLQELVILKRKFGMSIQAWIYRAKDLGIISESKMKEYFISLRKENQHKEEPGGNIQSEKPMRMEQLIHHAVAEDIISMSRANELFQSTHLPNKMEI